MSSAKADEDVPNWDDTDEVLVWAKRTYQLMQEARVRYYEDIQTNGPIKFIRDGQEFYSTSSLLDVPSCTSNLTSEQIRKIWPNLKVETQER